MSKRNYGYIRQLKSGRFQASYIDSGGTRRNAPDTFEKRKAADDWLTSIRVRLTRNEITGTTESLQMFDTYATDWLVERIQNKPLRPKTAQLYASVIDSLLCPFLGSYALKDISPTVVRAWRSWLIGHYKAKVKAKNMPQHSSTGASSTAKAYRVLHTILEAARRDQIIASNPCVLEDMGADKHRERKPATREELDTIAAHMPERYQALIHVAAWSGLRFSELAALTRADVVSIRDSSGRKCFLLNVSKQTYTVGATVYENAEPKTAAGKRRVILPAHITPILEQHLSEFTPEPVDALVFGSRNRTPMTDNTIGKMFRKARTFAGRDDLRFHDLRHTCATYAAESGATTKELMNFMGHSTPKAALIYQHTTDAGLLRVAERMNELAQSTSERARVEHGLTVIEGSKQTASTRNVRARA